MDGFASGYTFLYMAVVVFVAAFAKGTTSFGYGLVATPLLAADLGLKESIAVLILPNVLMDLVLVSRRGGVRLGQVIELRWFYLPMFPAIFIGTQLVAVGSPDILLFILGCCTLAYVVFGLAGAPIRLEQRRTPFRDAIFGVLFGGFLGLTNGAGPIAAVFLSSVGLDKEGFVKSFALLSLLSKIIQLASIGYFALLDRRTALMSLALLLPLWMGFLVGIKAYDSLAESHFSRVVLWLLGATAVWLIYRGLAAYLA